MIRMVSRYPLYRGNVSTFRAGNVSTTLPGSTGMLQLKSGMSRKKESKKAGSSLRLEDSAGQSGWTLVKRMSALAWTYKWGCLRLLLLNVLLLALSLSGLGLMGLGVDYIRFETGRTAPAAVVPAIPAAAADRALPPPDALSRPRAGEAKAPRWPFGLYPPESWTPFMTLLAIACGIVAFAVLRAAFSIAAAIANSKLIQGRVVVDLRSKVYDKMQRLSFRFFDANASGSLINRVTGDVQSLRAFIDGVLIQTAILLISLAFYFSYMLSIHPGLTAACLATTPLLAAATIAFSRAVRPAYEESRRLYDRLILLLSENIQGMHVIKGFARQEQEIRRFDDMNRGYCEQQFWIFRRIAAFQPCLGLLTHANMVVMLAYGSVLVIRHEQAPDAAAAAAAGVSVGQLLVFAGLLQQFSNQVGSIAGISNTMQQSLIAAQRVFEVLDAPVEIKSAPGAARLPRKGGGISFEKVSFSYDRKEPMLRDISFLVKPGQCAAIVGETGSGKSTLLSLIPRFFDPDRGRVLVAGVDVRNLDLDDLRRSIGMVFQESFLFSNTVAANIAFGSVSATPGEIERAARTACAHDFIMKMSRGYDTVLHEGGLDLSGGQRQRLAIARALVHQPPILLMDDPTASVDSETEKEIMEAIESALQGRTSIIVSHRLSTLRRADKVIVLKKGRIVQSGTHEELMLEQEGQYRMAADMQAPESRSMPLMGGIAAEDGLG